jgi:prephenate dehydrogenase
LGLALRRAGSGSEVVGFDISPDNLHRAAREGAITRSCGTLAEVCEGAQVLVLAPPVRAILRLLPEIAPHVQQNTLVTDTGGTKAEIVRVAEAALPPHAAFVGGHPLAGRLTAGVDQSSGDMFLGATYCLTPTPTAPQWGVGTAVQFVEELGAQPHFLTPEEHDALLAGASHLPYFASAAIVRAVTGQQSWSEMTSMAAGGFRTVSAPLEADPSMWTDVAFTNGENITRQLDELIAQLTSLRDKIASKDEALTAELQQAQDAHRAWLAQRGEAPPAPPPSSSSRSQGWTGWLRRG